MGRYPSKAGILQQVAGLDLILASTSTSRAHLLRAAGVPFRAVPSGLDEGPLKERLRAAGNGATAAAAELARAKAMACGDATGQALVLGADQILTLGDVWFDKPASLADAKRELLQLAGRTHELHTALALVQAGEVIWRHAEIARLTMWSFEEAFVESYLAEAGDKVLGSVGAYHLEGLGVQLFQAIEGDFFAILGLPLLPLLGFLRGGQR